MEEIQELPGETISAPQRRRITIRLGVVFFVGVIVFILINLIGIYFFAKSYLHNRQVAQIPVLGNEELSGHILFGNDKGIQSLDPKTQKPQIILAPGPYDWMYQNGYVFLSSSSAVVRFSLKTHQKDEITIPNIGSSEIYPSPNGQNVYVLDLPGYPGDARPVVKFIYDYATKTEVSLPDGGGFYKWLPDSKHIILVENSKLPPSFDLPDGSYDPSLKLSLYNLVSGKKSFLFEGPVRSMAVSQKGSTIIWYSDSSGPITKTPKEQVKPMLFYAHLDLAKDAISHVTTIPPSAFPIVLNKYYSGTLVGDGYSENTFFMTVGDKDMGIYEINTDTSTIRKITPKGPFSYKMVTYNATLGKVLAYKYPDAMYPLNLQPSQVKGYKYKPQVVLLDVKGNASEKSVATLTGLLPNMQFVFSPDNTLILGPVYSDQSTDSKFTIFSLANPSRMREIYANFLERFYWIQ